MTRSRIFAPRIVLLLLCSLLTASCSSPQLLEGVVPRLQEAQVTPSMVEMTFFVQVPPETPTEEAVYLNTLDEVTGLGVNAQAHEMEPAFGETTAEQGLTYHTTLAVPVGSVIKYRYTRRDPYSVVEHTDTGDQVRYRMVHAATPGEVQDIIYQWSDTTYTGPEPGRISGRIVDKSSGQPIPGVLVTAGGVQAFTTADGTFLLSGLPPGVHNLVAYALDGAYHITQQGAQVASQANTEAILELTPREYVDVTFVAEVPSSTPQQSVRLAGNLYQLGNTFGNLTGGMNTIPARMPKLTQVDDTHYGIILSLPVGAEIRYKYTLGDGFWNAEHTTRGTFHLRRFIVPDQNVQRDDIVETWSSGEQGPITFDLTAPSSTPDNEDIYIQFNPYGWTTPLPMLKVGPHHWAYILYSPLNIISDLEYRYCRAGECGIADDAQTAGESPAGREVSITESSTYQEDRVQDWAWLEDQLPADPDLASAPSSRPSFITGIELLPGYSPPQPDRLLDIMKEIYSLNAGQVTLTPTWSFSHQTPPVLEPRANQDPLWLDLESEIQAAKTQNLDIALYPHPRFPSSAEEWWVSADRDFGWWNSWFDQYRRFLLHYAEAAQRQELDTLVLGGPWLIPALPGGKLPDGSPSGVPADAELRWDQLLQEVKERYNGTVAWAMPLPENDIRPRFFQHIDQVYIQWTPALQDEESRTLEEMTQSAEEDLAAKIKPLWESWLKEDGIRLVLSIAYPSVEGGSRDCLPLDGEDCVSPGTLLEPAPDLPSLKVDFRAQTRSYAAILNAIQDEDWVSGIISRGYYPPAILHDKSSSIHGKPASRMLSAWFRRVQP